MALSSAELSLSFATLTPESKAAQTHLASLVAKHRSDAVGSPMDLVVATRHLTNLPSSDTSDPASRSKHTIIFTLGRERHGRVSGWAVGKLDSDKHAQHVNVPICSPRSRCFKGRRLFDIFIHPKSGVLMIRNANDSHSLWYLNADNQGNHSTSAYSASRKVYMQRQLGNWDHDHIRLRHVILHNVIAKGDTCVVRAGVDRKTGDPIACKTMQCSRGNIEDAVNEISIASIIAARASGGLVPLLSKSCGHGFPLPCSHAEFEDMHLVMPYAPFTFDTAPWQEIRPPVKLALFRHALEGLKNLHAAGIMHRDINPSNLLVFSLQPATAAIGDFGMAKVGSQGAEKSLGLLAYQAPEVATQETYTNAIDIFSLALSFLATFEGCMWSGPLSDQEHYSAMLNHLSHLETRMPDGLATLLRTMLSWDSSHRPSAEDVLTDAVWEQIAEPDSVRPSDCQLRPLMPEPSPPFSSSNSNTSNTPGVDDLNQRMKRSGAPPPSDFGNDGGGSTTEVHGRDDMSERMNRSEAPSPSSAANDDN
ncbi:kinase-like protein [Trichoderma citrinoviride]|uniref:Kinase-like protein n=1 Tax=Trichoderma citrinoviride TaxID=58853 RepID=A0A2T4BJ00_9HYPO|nr:kinase-like protein [Trichoderma citrinoviride]PTB69229.1 kinase-like protein [Trichoderma citrinoviride]